MSRKRKAKQRRVSPDYRYGDQVITRLINCIMWEGKKTIAEGIVYTALESAAAKVQLPPIELFDAVLKNVIPALEVRSRRVGGASYQVPVAVSASRGLTLALRWIRNAARAAGGKSMTDRLSTLLLDSYHNRGAAVSKKNETHRMAEANRAFSHYAMA